jgi:CRP/FNR family transcriptional regulator
MLNTTLSTAAPVSNMAMTRAMKLASAPDRKTDAAANQLASQHIADTLQLLSDALPVQRRVVHAGDTIYQAGERFGNLYILNSGFIKIVNLSPDGREQVVGLKFRGDWLGFDGIAHGQYSCDAVAMDTGEVWVMRYDALLAACAARPMLLTVLHGR